MASFSAQVSAAVGKHRQRMLATFHGAAQEVAEEVTRPVGHGGPMRVKTGFLRSSLMASTASMPMIEPNAVPADGAADNSYQPDLGTVSLVIAGSTLDDVIHLGFTAAYARHREYKDGFVRLTAQRWPQIVATHAANAQRAFP